MNLPRFSVQRPVFTTMITLIIVILGAVSLSRLQIDLLPNIELPTLTVRTSYEGADPEVVESLVTQIVEEIVGTVPGVEEMTSISSEGSSNVRVRFAWGTDIDAAAMDVRSTLEDELSELPEGIDPPQIRKYDIASYPVVIVGISSKLAPVELTELIENQVRYRFARIPGVAQADMFGGYDREVRIELDIGRVKALNIPLDIVLDAVRDANLDLPAGEIEQGRYEVTLRAPAEFVDLDQIRSTVVAVRDGAPVTLGQIAQVKDTYEKLTSIARVNGEKGLRIGIRKQPQANTVEVSERILAEIKEVNRDFPQINVVAVTNQGNFIERSIENVAQSVLYGGGLAVVVLLFFLRNIRSTVVISLAIPISIVATFALIYFGGFTLNLMTLGGLALGVGMMVDSSIVVLENIYRRREEAAEPPVEASVSGTNEVATAIIASTITTLVIFLPLIFVRGVTGILFKELAYTIVFALICSLLVSLSLVPMLASKLLKNEDPNKTRRGPIAWLAGVASGAFGALDNAYRDLLRLVLRVRLLTVLLAVGALVAALQLVPMIGTEYMPPSDEGEVEVTGEMEVGTRLGLLDQQTRKMEQIIYPAVPEAEASVVRAGGSGYRPTSATRGEVTLSLVPATQRERSNVEIADDLRKRLEGQVPGMEIRVRAPQGQFLLERVIDEDEGLSVEVRGHDLQTLDLLAGRVAEAIKDVPGVTDVRTSREAGVPQEMIRIDRDKAADLGLSARDISEALKTAVAGTETGEYRVAGNSYRILVQLKDAEKLSLDEILDLTLTSSGGEEVALRNVVTVSPGRGPIFIDRKDQQRLATVSANVSGRDLGSVAADIEERLAAIPRPVDYDFAVAGDFEEQQEAFAELIVSLVLALVLVYMVLACQYESLRDPLVVMLSVPMAAIGVLLTLFLTETTLNVQSYIGCIMLGGIVVNNAILLVDQAGQLRGRAGWSTREAVAEAGRRRLRPILMTTLTTMLGLLPLALGIGEGADAQAPLARAVIGGLLASTVITLVLIPAVYSLFHPDAKGDTHTPDGEPATRGVVATAMIPLAMILLTTMGCAPKQPDRWKTFDVEWQKRITANPGRPMETAPQDVQPRATEPPPLPALDGDGPIEVSLEQAVLLALRNNRDLAVAQFNPVIVGTFERIERGVFDPELFGNIEYLRENAEETARSTGERFNVKGRDREEVLGLRQQLPTGTTVEGTIGQNSSSSNRAPEQEEARLGLTVTQALLRGRGPAVNLATIRQAQLDTVASMYELRGFTEALLAETETAYWNYVLAAEEIAIFQRSLDVARQQRDDVEQRITVGVLPETEAAAARAEVARREQALIDARSGLESQRLQLVRLMNPNPSGRLDREVRYTTDPRVRASPLADVDERLALAQQSRPDLNEAKLRLDQNRLQTIVTRNGLLPRLDLFMSVGKTGYADSFTGSFRKVYGDTYDFAVGARFSHLLGNRAAEARDDAAWTSRRQSAAAIANLRQLIDLDVRLALNEVERARQQIDASATTRTLQEQTLSAERQRFEVGASTALLVAQAQRDLLAAQIAEVKSTIAYRIALVRLYLAEGSLLERRGIRLGVPGLPSRGVAE